MAAQGLTTEFRRTAEYAQWVEAIQQENPHLPRYLVDMAIFTHLGDPQGYKRHVSRPGAPLPPPSTPKVAVEQVVVEGAVRVLEAGDPSLDVPMIAVAAE